jgi:pyridoxamine 5'-phosphate oxidase
MVVHPIGPTHPCHATVWQHRTVDLDAKRAEYESTGFDVADLDPDPVAQVERWRAEWAAIAPNEPSAVILATADATGQPSARTVLLRGLDGRGATFFTSYESRKGDELAANPWGALLFSWVPLLRQVNLRGRVEQVPREESEAYFAGRPRGSQLAAWASHQSSVLADRDELEARFAAAQARFEGAEVPCPPTWGGYRLVPDEIELWQGRQHRMHDRLRYERAAGPPEGWRVVRLSP